MTPARPPATSSATATASTRHCSTRSSRTPGSRVLAINEAAYGPGHPEVAASANTLALALRASGRPAEALPLFDRALAISEATFGPDHPEVARTQNNRALALVDLGKTAEALDLVRQALTVAEATYGPEHPYSTEVRSCEAPRWMSMVASLTPPGPRGWGRDDDELSPRR